MGSALVWKSQYPEQEITQSFILLILAINTIFPWGPAVTMTAVMAIYHLLRCCDDKITLNATVKNEIEASLSPGWLELGLSNQDAIQAEPDSSGGKDNSNSFWQIPDSNREERNVLLENQPNPDENEANPYDFEV